MIPDSLLLCYNLGMQNKTELPLSIAILAHNEEKNLPRALESIKDWDVEIVVVDADSTDKTHEIAKKYTDKVYKHQNEAQLNINKMNAFKQCTREWIFYLDADEEMTSEIKKEIEQAIQSTEFDGYWVPRKNIVFGTWLRYGGNYPDAGLRLFRRLKGKFECKHVHEHLEVDGKVGELKVPFNHYTYEDLAQWVFKMNFYTSLEGKLINERGKNPWVHIFIRPPYKFIRNYIFKGGILDGKVGFIYACLNGYYDFISGAKALTSKKS